MELPYDDRRRTPRHRPTKVIAVMPYSAGRVRTTKDRPRVPIGAETGSQLLVAAGVGRIMTMDLHADQIRGFFDVPVDALYASGISYRASRALNIEDLSIAAPDMGGAKRTPMPNARRPNHHLAQGRAKANIVGKMTAIGDVKAAT